ncbi:N/A [soil metagenome]
MRVLSVFFLLAGCVVIPLATSVPTSAVTQVQDEQYGALPEVERVRTLINLTRSGHPDIAAELLAHHPLTGPFAANRTLFIDGLILKARGDKPGAAQKFRKALADDPTLTMVRAELSQTLYEMGDDDSAKHHLELLMGEAPTAKEARNIKDFIDAIDARRPFRISAYISLAPSTNINGGSSHDWVTIGGLDSKIDQRKESGIGIAAGVNAAYTFQLSDDFSAIAAGGLHTRQYEASDNDLLSLSETIEFRRRLEDGYFGFGALASQSLSGDLATPSNWSDFDGSMSTWAAGPRLTLFQTLAPDLAFNGDITLIRQEYDDQPYRNGWRTTLEGKLSKAFSSALTGYASGGFETYMTSDRPDLDYNAIFGTLGLYKELPYGISATAELNLRREVYQANFNDAVPEFAKPRRDIETAATLSLWKRDWSFWGYSPAIEYTYVWHDSNVAFYDYDSHTVDVRLTKDF